MSLQIKSNIFRIFHALIVISLFCLPSLIVEGKRVKQTLKIEKERNRKEKDNLNENDNEFCEIFDNKLLFKNSLGNTDTIDCSTISFSGYEKEISSSKESFIIKNGSERDIKGFIIDITYLDLKDRMLHKRRYKTDCEVPSGENRKVDISTWDSQHTYFYYRGNEPKKTATPYKVKITAVSYKFEE